jgi:L-aminopeptidase/D-esterase-like protein
LDSDEARKMKIVTHLLCASAIACAGGAQSPTPRADSAAKGLTDVPGILVGHYRLAERPTGCTVILAQGEGAVPGIAQRGGAPGTRETSLIDPMNAVERIHGISFAGGSTFGLDAATGVMRYLEEKGVGIRFGGSIIPLVPGAIVFDLRFGGDAKIRPTADCGYRAAAAASADRVREGNVGAGSGATVGKMGGTGRTPMKGGVGTASIRMADGLVVAALVVVNAVGDIIDPTTGQIVAGTRNADGTFADARLLLRNGSVLGGPPAGENTTIGVVATNARLTKAQMQRVAHMADDGLARTIYPAHTMSDGDTMFGLATGRWEGQADVSRIGALAADVVAEAIVRAVARADSLGGLVSARQTRSIPARLR